MGRREGRRITREMKKGPGPRAQGAGPDGPQLIACGRIRGGVSETYITFRSMATTDEICTAAVRKVLRAVTAGAGHKAQGAGVDR